MLNFFQSDTPFVPLNELTKEEGTSRQSFEIELDDACYFGFDFRPSSRDNPQSPFKIESLEFLELTPIT